MRSLAYYEKYEDLRNMISASFDIQDFIKEGVQKFPRMIPTSRWNTHWLDYAKQVGRLITCFFAQTLSLSAANLRAMYYHVLQKLLGTRVSRPRGSN